MAIFKAYKTFIRGLDILTNWLSIFSTALLVIVMITNVVFRYFLKIPLIWADEVSLFLFAWCTFLGASLGIKNNNMAAITIILDVIPEKALRIIKIVIQLFVICFSLVVTIAGTKWLLEPSTINTIAPSSQMPMWIPYMILPIGMIFIIIFAIDNIVNLIRNKPKSDNLKEAV